MKDFLSVAGGVLMLVGFLAGGMILFVCLVWLITTPFQDHGCYVYGRNTGRQVKYAMFTSECYVKTNNGWFTQDQINQNNVTN